MTDQRFSWFLTRSLGLLHLDAPLAYARVAELLKGRPVLVVVDRETLALRNVDNDLSVTRPSGDERVLLETKRAVILDLVEARCSIVDAVLDEALHVRGPIEHVLTLYDAMMAYLEGAVRSPRFPALFEEYLSADPHHEPAATRPMDE